MLKTMFYVRKRWATQGEARSAVVRWIEVVYSCRRRHSALGMVCSVDFECHIAQGAAKKATAA